MLVVVLVAAEFVVIVTVVLKVAIPAAREAALILAVELGHLMTFRAILR